MTPFSVFVDIIDCYVVSCISFIVGVRSINITTNGRSIGFCTILVDLWPENDLVRQSIVSKIIDDFGEFFECKSDGSGALSPNSKKYDRRRITYTHCAT